MLEPWKKELTLSMIPKGHGMYHEIAELIGVENLLKLAELIGGTTFYFPKQDTFLRPLRDVKIREEYDGYNGLEICRKYGVSERWIRQITNSENDKEDKS